MYRRCLFHHLPRVQPPHPQRIKFRSQTQTRFSSTTPPRDKDPFFQTRVGKFLFRAAVLSVSVTAFSYLKTVRESYFPPSASSTTSSSSFQKYTLFRKNPVSSTSSIFQLEPKDSKNVLKDVSQQSEIWTKGIWNVEFLQPQLQIVRAYTPLPSLVPAREPGEDEILEFLIRHDDVNPGEVSSWLNRLKSGSEIQIRGPNFEYEIAKDVKRVVFIAGGTGIAPALQVAKAMFSDGSWRDREKELCILWANKRREDCAGGKSDGVTKISSGMKSWFGGTNNELEGGHAPIGLMVSEIEWLKKMYEGCITVDYFVDEEKSTINKETLTKLLDKFGKVTTQGNLRREQQQVIVSGPAGFISYIAGAKEWKNGVEAQGRIGGLIGQALQNKERNFMVYKV